MLCLQNAASDFWQFLSGTLSYFCAYSLQRNTNCKNLGIRTGDRVLLSGDRSGVVRWIGALDSDFVNSDVFVGVQLDDPGTLRGHPL